jgi:hypothetical protein
MAKDDYAAIVAKHRRKQLSWTKESVKRFDAILQHTAMELVEKLRAHAGTGTMYERYLQAVLSDFSAVLDVLKADYAELLGVQLLGSAQIAAGRELAIAGTLFSADDLAKVTEGMAPDITKTATINGIGEVSVTFGRVAQEAVNAIYQRVYEDGLNLSDRLWRLDNATRTAIADQVVGAVVSGQSARDLANSIKAYLTDPDEGNARYNAMRLARTEINNAHREGHIRSATDANGDIKDYISAIGFRLSMSHPAPDICDVWASQDINGLGPGNYLPASVPVDHPHGLCFTVTILKAHPELQFEGKTPDAQAVTANQLEAYGIEIADKEPGGFTSIAEAEQWGRKTYPNIGWKLGGCHVDTINPTLSEFHRQAQKYPEAAARLTFFRTMSMPNAYAGFGVRRSDKACGFAVSKIWYNDKEALLQQLHFDGSKNFHPKGCDTIEAVMAHEYGHLVDHHLQMKSSELAVEVKRWKREHPVGRELSRYAEQSAEEAWAEGYSVIDHGAAEVKQLDYVKELKRFIKDKY